MVRNPSPHIPASRNPLHTIPCTPITHKQTTQITHIISKTQYTFLYFPASVTLTVYKAVHFDVEFQSEFQAFHHPNPGGTAYPLPNDFLTTHSCTSHYCSSSPSPPAARPAWTRRPYPPRRSRRTTRRGRYPSYKYKIIGANARG